MVYRVYVEKKPQFAEEARRLLRELRLFCGITALTDARVVQRYDVEGIDQALFDKAARTILSEPPLDTLLPDAPAGDFVLAAEYLPGQFDQRAQAASDCIRLLSPAARPLVACARVYAFSGALSSIDKHAIERFLINPVDSRKASAERRATLSSSYPEPGFPPVLFGASDAGNEAAALYIERYALAMDTADFAACAAYFKSERRDPTLTELRVLDTYWSDHCRHTTFETVIDEVTFEPGGSAAIAESFSLWRSLRAELGREDAPLTLMDLATTGAKTLRARGALPGWDQNEEVNACAVKVDVDVNGAPEPWLLLFKNETHNHPTEIEPFGGAATCLGGAIRDPLSGRAYVYQAMRVSGAGDPRKGPRETLAGKLPQRQITQQAARGFSAYGNQIGLATGLVREWYHEGYRAKRLEAGAVVGAAPAVAVRRKRPAPGDVVVLVGGRTGRDGCGGATGSSKAHTAGSLAVCGAEVQKGNAPEERKLQRLFRDPRAARLVKRCNDFGAGGVAVAVGELAAGLDINLDAIPKKYEGLDGTELAISESQERMAVVLAPEDAAAFLEYAGRENLEGTVIATVTDTRRLVMTWRGRAIASIARDFLDTNGAKKHTRVAVPQTEVLRRDMFYHPCGAGLGETLRALLGGLNVCSQRGLIERFDSTIGAGTVLMPLGGKYQRTPEEVMAALIPVAPEPAAPGGPPRNTTTASGMAHGFDPRVAERSPYEGAYLAVLESLARLVAAGFPRANAYLSLQEYFPRPGNDPARWAAPFSALLGALQAQLDLGVAAIGGKDSMSGTFEDKDVPPTLISFALSTGSAANIRGSAFNAPGHTVLWARPWSADERELRPRAASFLAAASFVERLLAARTPEGRPLALAARTVSLAGPACALFMMAAGNRVGFCAGPAIDEAALFLPAFGSFLVELDGNLQVEEALRAVYETEEAQAAALRAFSCVEIGRTTGEYTLSALGAREPLDALESLWEGVLEEVFPCRAAGGEAAAPAGPPPAEPAGSPAPAPPARGHSRAFARPLAIIPVFSGTNCEADTARALAEAGLRPEVFVARTLSAERVSESAALLAKALRRAQILVLPGGFSGADEPDGSAKLIAAFFRGGILRDAVAALLEKQDGLILGICNGFQALVKLGLLPDGVIREQTADSCALTFNTIGRHQSRLVTTKIVSARSPWFLCEEEGALHTVPVSHGEGRFTAPARTLDALARGRQIATVYVDAAGAPSMDGEANPAGSLRAIEGITSPCGRILGKMGHSERRGALLYRNVPGPSSFQRLFEGAATYFGPTGGGTAT